MKSLEIFINRVKQTVQSKGKEIRINIDEANILSLDLATMLNRENELLKKIDSLEQQIKTGINYTIHTGANPAPIYGGEKVMSGVAVFDQKNYVQPGDRTMVIADVHTTDGGKF